MALRQLRKTLLEHIANNGDYLAHNKEILAIYEGDLLPRVLAILEKTVSAQYFEAIKHRALPINILQRYIGKVATIYNKPPTRISNFQDHVDFYAENWELNENGNCADEYAYLFKGFAWEPYYKERMGKKEIKLRTLPYDRFMVYSTSGEDPLEETVFIKIMGKDGRGKRYYYAYTNDEFDAFDEEGESVRDALEIANGVNPIGLIPMVYGNRSKTKLIPTQDKDILQMSLMLSVMLSDLAGAILFQAYTIIYGIDVDSANLKMSPNAFWSFASDPKSDKTPSIGTIKPAVDIDSVKTFIVEVFVMWLETKGIRVGSMGSMQSTSVASGLSKIIDEMDIFDVKVKSLQFFQNDERELWSKLPFIHNYYIEQGIVTGLGKLPTDGSFYVEVKFEDPLPMKDRIEVLAEIEKERQLGLSTAEMRVRKANPTADNETIQEILEENNQAQTIEVEEDATAEGDDTDPQGIPPRRETGDSAGDN